MRVVERTVTGKQITVNDAVDTRRGRVLYSSGGTRKKSCPDHDSLLAVVYTAVTTAGGIRKYG